MIANGCNVIAVGQESENKWKSKFLEHGIDYYSIRVNRNSINPIHDIRTFFSIYKLLKEHSPDKLFVYQAKTIVYGAIASKILGIKDIFILIAGTGSVFRSQGFISKLVKTMLTAQYYIACRIASKVFFQNNDDKNQFLNSNILKDDKTYIINGSGVNLLKFTPSPLPIIPTFIYIGRLIRDKGIIEYLKACEILKSKHANSICILVGPFDTNPSSITLKDLKPYITQNIIEYYGEQDDVLPYLIKSSVLVLPSYHEGTPKSVLEAMATKRAIITTDAPGCRETVIDNESGFIVQVKNINLLAEKMIYLYENPDVIAKMAAKSLEICREKYDVIKINNKILEVMKISQIKSIDLKLQN